MTRGAVPVLSRRAFVGTLFAAPGVAALACSKAPPPFSCTDVSGLTEPDRSARVILLYQDLSPTPEKECERCTQYVPAAEGCGSCKVVRGPIHPRGTCKVFAAK